MTGSLSKLSVEFDKHGNAALSFPHVSVECSGIAFPFRVLPIFGHAQGLPKRDMAANDTVYSCCE